MNGSTLKYLAGVADLARLDIEAAGVTLRTHDAKITAGYAGAYARGMRTADYPAGMPINVSVSALRFKTIAGMFDDDADLNLADDNGLRIRSRSTNALLRQWGELSDFPELNKRGVKLAARLPAANLIAEIETAIAFVATSQVRPEFTGILLALGPDSLTIRAFDGGGALYQSIIKPSAVKGAGSLIAPAHDFLLGARLIDGDAIVCAPSDSKAIAVYNDRALFRSSLIAATWPDLSSVTAKRKAATFSVDSSQIRNLVAGAKALGSGPDISVKSKRGFVLFGAESESGSFAVATAGELPADLFYDAETLGRVAKIGTTLTFNVPAKPHEPTLVTSEHRRCWVVTRI